MRGGYGDGAASGAAAGGESVLCVVIVVVGGVWILDGAKVGESGVGAHAEFVEIGFAGDESAMVVEFSDDSGVKWAREILEDERAGGGGEV